MLSRGNSVTDSKLLPPYPILKVWIFTQRLNHSKISTLIFYAMNEKN